MITQRSTTSPTRRRRRSSRRSPRRSPRRSSRRSPARASRSPRRSPARASRRRSRVPESQFYCVRERRFVTVHEAMPGFVMNTRNGRETPVLRAVCPRCGSRVTKFVKWH